MRIPQNTFLVTGGASGLGEACVRRLADKGANIIIADLNESAAQNTATRLDANVQAIGADVTNETGVAAAIELAKKQFGALHGVAHCAGIIAGARIVGKDGPHDLALFERIIRVNLVGTFNVLRLAGAAMATNPPGEDGERGVFIAAASVAAFDGQIGQAAYAASKGGVASLMLPAARELARFGIRVMAIAPGALETPMVTGLAAETQASLAGQTPFPPRLGRPDEFAQLVEQIIENPMLNGGVIRLDGALRMGAK